MKTKKIMMALSMALCIVSASSLSVFAKENGTSTALQKQNKQDVISEALKSGVSQINDSRTVVSEVLTFNQIVQEIANDKNISILEAQSIVKTSYSSNTKQLGITSTAVSDMYALSATYRTLTAYVYVTGEYEPQLKFYCQTNEWSGSFRAIDKILDVSMNRSYNGISKQFGGTVYVNLEAPNRIYWRLEGDFYNNGTTTVGFGGEIGVGESSSINFSVSSSSNHYAYCYKTGYTYF